MTPEQLDEIEAQINEFGEESGFILPLVKALREARELIDKQKADAWAWLCVAQERAKERDAARTELEYAVAENGALYDAQVAQSEAEQERDAARAEVERLRSALRLLWEEAQDKCAVRDDTTDAVEAALKEGDR